MCYPRPLLALFFVVVSALLAQAQPTTLLLSPAPESEVFSHEMVVSATVSGPLAESLPLDTARLFVDDRDVTAWCLRHETLLSYRPLSPPSEGEVQARIEFANGVTKRWSFTVVPHRAIQSVTHNGAQGLGEYEELEVVVVGDPGGRATFHMGKGADEPMVEDEENPGHYSGTYTVQPGDSFMGETLTGRLLIDGRLSELEADEPLSIFGHIFKVRILSPPSGSSVPNNFPIRGRTRPGSKVVLVPRLSFNRNTPPPNTAVGGGGGSIETRADDEGFFELYYGVPLSLPNLSVVLSVYAVNRTGDRSVPVTLRYHF